MKREAIKQFLKNDATLAAAISGGFMLLFGLMSITTTHDFASWVGCLITSAGLGAIISKARRKYVNNLTRRIEESALIDWEVTLNGVMVGMIKDAEYAAICLRTFNDKRIYIAQMFNIGKVFIKVFDYLCIVIPLGVFWVFVAFAVFSPDTFGSIIAALQNGGAAAIASVVKIGAELFGLLMVMSILIHVALGSMSRFSFVNLFSETINRAVRQHCSAAAEGDITISRVVLGTTKTLSVNG